MFWALWLILVHRLIMHLLIPEFSAYLEYSFCDKLLQIHLLKVKRKIYSSFTCGEYLRVLYMLFIDSSLLKCPRCVNLQKLRTGGKSTPPSLYYSD